MEKESCKKELAKTVSLVLVTVLLLSACGGNTGNSTEPDSQQTAPQEETLSWIDNHVSLSRHYDGIAVEGDTIYGYYTEGNSTQVVVQDMKSGEIRQTAEIADVTNINEITVDEAGNIYLTELSDNNFAGTVWKVDTQGQTEKVEGIIFENLADDGWYLLQDTCVDKNGYRYVWCTVAAPTKEFFPDYVEDIEGVVTYSFIDRIYVKDAEWNTLYYEQIPDSHGYKMLSFSLNEKGIPTILGKDSEGTYIQELDVEQKGVKPQKRLEGIDFVQGVDYEPYGQLDSVAFTEDGFLYCKGNNLYRYSYDAQEQETLFNLSSYGVLGENIMYLAAKDGEIQMVDNYKQSENSEYVSFSLGVDTKEKVTLGVMLLSAATEDLVTGFNRFSDDCRIEVVTYAKGGDYEQEAEQFQLDLVSGEAPDILEVGGGINDSLYAGKGAFADLYSFMENDSSFDRSELQENVLEACETDGHLYSLGYAFQLYSI